MKKRMIIIAAGIPLLLLMVIGVKALFDRNTPKPINEQTPWGATEYADAKDLSKAAGVEINNLKAIPFDAKEIIYQHYENGVAEIIYQNETDSLAYRVSKSAADDDAYSDLHTLNLKGTVITLKGKGKKVFVAEYSKGGNTHSIHIQNGIDEKGMREFLDKNI